MMSIRTTSPRPFSSMRIAAVWPTNPLPTTVIFMVERLLASGTTQATERHAAAMAAGARKIEGMAGLRADAFLCPRHPAHRRRQLAGLAGGASLRGAVSLDREKPKTRRNARYAMTTQS